MEKVEWKVEGMDYTNCAFNHYKIPSKTGYRM